MPSRRSRNTRSGDLTGECQRSPRQQIVDAVVLIVPEFDSELRGMAASYRCQPVRDLISVACAINGELRNIARAREACNIDGRKAEIHWPYRQPVHAPQPVYVRHIVLRKQPSRDPVEPQDEIIDHRGAEHVLVLDSRVVAAVCQSVSEARQVSRALGKRLHHLSRQYAIAQHQQMAAVSRWSSRMVP